MKEIEIVLTMMVDNDYSQEDIDDIVGDIKEIIGMTDSGEIRYESGEAKFVEED